MPDLTLTAVYAAASILSATNAPNAPKGGYEMAEFAREAHCLAKVIYTEGRGVHSPRLDQMIADVVVNSTKRWNHTICAEARKPGRYHGVEGFTAPRGVIEKNAWLQAVDAATTKLTYRLNDDWTDGARWFYSGGKRPWWATKMTVAAAAGGFKFLAKEER